MDPFGLDDRKNALRRAKENNPDSNYSVLSDADMDVGVGS